MKKKVVSVMLVAAMAATLFAGCGTTEETQTAPDAGTSANEAVTSTEAGDAAGAAADAVSGDLADKKVGVCIYQFSDNFDDACSVQSLRSIW